uniref:exodeoxyribonuclease III n=1 Tax=Oryzias latipes TaxID=8090 RepID=A0A3B3HW68_ORYLA
MSLCFCLLMVRLLSLNIRGVCVMERIKGVLGERCDILCLQEVHWENETRVQAEKLWGGSAFYAEGPRRTAGVAVFVRGGVFDNVTLREVDPAGRFLMVDLEWAGKQLRLISIYASNDQVERQSFFHSLRPFLNDFSLLVGDFNTVLSPADLSVRNVFRNDVGRKELFSIMSDYGIIDVWRVLNHGKRDFSKRQLVKGVLKQSRTDHVISACSVTRLINGVTYIPHAWSDHAWVEVVFDGVKVRNGGGMWILNNSVLGEIGYQKRIKSLLSYHREQMDDAVDIFVWWEDLKTKIKSSTITYCKKRTWDTREDERDVRAVLKREASLLAEDPNRDAMIYSAALSFEAI